MSVAEAQARISSREFAEWMAFMRVEPLGAERLDYWMATLLAFLANMHRDPKKRRKPWRVRDFWPRWWRVSQRGDWRAMKAMVEMLNAAMGGKDLRKG